MMHSAKCPWVWLSLLVCLVIGLVGCGSNPQGQPSDEGNLQLALVGTGLSGARYRLLDATFVVSGISQVTLSSETNPEAEHIATELKAGDYLIELVSGWHLGIQSPDKTYAPVNAVLVSSNPTAFTIRDQLTSSVRFRFTAGNEAVELGNGRLVVGIDVNDGTSVPDGGLASVVTCKTILEANPLAANGVYRLAVSDRVFDGYCLMSRDGGGWTMVGKYPAGSASVSSNNKWASINGTGEPFSDPTVLFKMSDALINAIVTSTYRVHGTATECLQGPCMIDTMLYWGNGCVYSSISNSPACSTAYLDPELTRPTPTAVAGSNACTWHWGLVDTNCGVINGIVTNHDPDIDGQGIVVSAGTVSDFVHAANGRGNENPGIEMWVR